MKRKLTGMVLLVVLTGWQLAAQDSRGLTLDEAVRLSLQNSKQLKGSQARIEEATAALREAVEKKLPDAGVSGAYLRVNNPNLSLKSSNNGGSGGSGGNQGPIKVNQALYGMLNASLPIYQGGKIRYGIESARYLEQAARLDADADRDQVIQNTIEAFANLYKARKAVDLVKEDLEQARQRVRDFTNLEQNGLLARNDLLKAELQASNTELALLDADNNWKLANVNMDLLLGLPEQTLLEPDSASLAALPQEKPLDEYVLASQTSRKDRASLDLRRKAAETGVKSTRSDYLPGFKLTGGYIAADIPNLLTITNAVNIGVGVSYNLGSLWKTRARLEQAQARARQVSISESLLDDQIRLQVSQAYLNWLSSRKKIDVYAKAVEQATENYRITRNKHENNLATTADLLDADVAQLQANLNYVFAKADAVVAYNKLLEVAGIIDQYNTIKPQSTQTNQ
ncbi:MAG TPA: TolC family protein [Chitinophagaceae bacterium]|nr:TolC family protein [Chitinophagaceae bacterium]